MEILQQWGLDIIFGLISAAVMGYAKWHGNKLEKELQTAKDLAAEKERHQIEDAIEAHLEPVYQELDDLRKYVQEKGELEQSHTNLIIASYRFRLIQLCKGFLAQDYLTSSEMEQLTEFYKVYTGLGGNGQAKIYYEKAMALPLKDDKIE